jgi:multisubunit Na+/H+ antiporter MnhE subunit
MNLLVLNLAFAAVFAILLGTGRITDFFLGFGLGYVALWLTKPLYPDTRYFKKFPKALNLTGFFLKELAISNLKVLWDVITPGHINRPGIIGVPWMPGPILKFSRGKPVVPDARHLEHRSFGRQNHALCACDVSR